MDIEAYFRRVGYRGSSEPTYDTLRVLQKAHMLSVPFENLDIWSRTPIVLDEKFVFEKIVHQRRGGFCYEQNTLFAAILRELGFDVSLLEARVYKDDGSLGIPFDHLTLMVRLEERWLTDVGYGSSFLEPLQLDNDDVQVQGDQAFRVEHDGVQGNYFLHQDGIWQKKYRFTLKRRQLADFVEGCRYHQTSPDSIFTRNRICSIALPDGRISLINTSLIITRGSKREEYRINTEAAFRQALKTYFEFDLDLNLTLNSNS